MNWNEIGKKYLVDTLEFIKSGKDLALTQGQLYIRELIKWEIVSNAVWSGLCLLIAIIFLVLAVKCFGSMKENGSYGGNDECIIGGSVSTIISTIAFVVFCSFASNSIKAYVAPRVVVIEKLQGVIR